MTDKSITILLVDDDADVLMTYADYLIAEGFNVDNASNGEAAFFSVKENPYKYDFVLIDHDLGDPQWDGFITTREIIKINKDIAVIIFSIKDEAVDEKDKFRALKVGALRYERKQKAADITSVVKELINEVKTLKELRVQLNEFTRKQKWLQITLFSSNLGMTIVDRNWRIYYMNQLQQNLLSDIHEPPYFFSEFFTEYEIRPFRHTAIQALFDGSQDDSVTAAIYTQLNGQWRYLQLYASPLKDSEGKIVRGSDNKPIALVLNTRFLDKIAVEQLNYKVRLEAIAHYLWQEFDHVRLYFADPDISRMKLLYYPGQEQHKGKVFDFREDPTAQWCQENRMHRVWDTTREGVVFSENLSREIGLPEITQWVDCPLFDKDKMLGWIACNYTQSQKRIDEKIVEQKIKPLVDEIILLLRNAKSKKVITIEPEVVSEDFIDLDFKIASDAHNPIDGLAIIIKEIKRICTADEAFIRFLNEKNELVYGTGEGEFVKSADKAIPIDEKFALSAIAARSKEAIFVKNTADNKMFQDMLKNYWQSTDPRVSQLEKVKSAIYFPVMLGTKMLGIIIIHSYSPAEYTSENLKIVSSIRKISQRTAHVINDYIPYLNIHNALKEAEIERTRFKGFLNAIGDEVSIVNKESTIVFVNEVKRERFQKEGENITDGKHKCWEVFEDRISHCPDCPDTKASKSKEVTISGSRIAYDKNKFPYLVEVTASPIRTADNNNDVDEVIEVCRKVGDTIRKRDELNASKELSGSNTEGLALTDYLHEAARLIKQVTFAQICSIYLWDNEWNKLALKATTCTLDKSEIAQYGYNEADFVSIKHFRDGKPINGKWQDLNPADINLVKNRIEDLYLKDSAESLAAYFHIPFKRITYEYKLDEIEVTRFENEIKKKVQGKSDKEFLLRCYAIDYSKKKYILRSATNVIEKTRISEIFKSIQYKDQVPSIQASGMIELVNKKVLDRDGYCKEKWGKEFRLDPRGFTEQDQEFLVSLGDQISAWVHNHVLMEEQKSINERMNILTETITQISRTKTLEELAYLILLAVTHKQGLSHNRAFLVLPGKESDEEFKSYAIGPKNREEAGRVWSEIPDYATLLLEFKNSGLPKHVLWDTKCLSIKRTDINDSWFIRETKQQEGKARIFVNSDLEYQDSSRANPFLTEFDKHALEVMGGQDNFCITILPIFEYEYGYLLVDNIIDHKQIHKIDLYLLRQYCFGFAAAIQRWYNTEKFKELAGQTAHEIRSVLQSITNYNALFGITKKVEKVRDWQEHINQEVTRGNDVVMLFIENIKKDSRFWELKKEKCLLIDIIQKAKDSVNAEAIRNEINIDIYGNPKIEVVIDPLKMQMVFVNLLRNAIKATPKKILDYKKRIFDYRKQNSAGKKQNHDIQEPIHSRREHIFSLKKQIFVEFSLLRIQLDKIEIADFTNIIAKTPGNDEKNFISSYYTKYEDEQKYILNPSINSKERNKIAEIVRSIQFSHIEITVTDRGIGLTPEQQKEIFEPFRGAGIGLGLPLSREIVQKHNGYISVTSRKDHGTDMKIVIPKE